jgi:hypothetical protein
MRFGHFLIVIYISTHRLAKRISEGKNLPKSSLEFYPKSLTSYAAFV